MIDIVFELLYYVINLFKWAVILAAMFSMLAAFGVLDTRNRIVWTIGDFLYRITEPVLRPIRNLLPNFGGIDISPLDRASLLIQIVVLPLLSSIHAVGHPTEPGGRWSSDRVLARTRRTACGRGEGSAESRRPGVQGAAARPTAAAAHRRDGASRRTAVPTAPPAPPSPARCRSPPSAVQRHARRHQPRQDAARHRRSRGAWEHGWRRCDRPHHRRQGGRRGACARALAERVAGLAVPARPRGGAGRRRSGQRRSMSAARTAPRGAAGIAAQTIRLPADTTRGGPAGADRAAERRPGGRRHPGAAAAARRRSTPQAVIEAIDPAKDVDGFHPLNVGRLADGRPGLVPCTPLGVMKLLDAAGVALAGARALVLGRSTHRRPADGGAAAGGQRHRDGRPFAHPRPARRVPPRRGPGGGGRQAGDGARRLDRAGRHGDRCRHQPAARRAAGGRCGLRRMRRRSPARSRRCPAASAR